MKKKTNDTEYLEQILDKIVNQANAVSGAARTIKNGDVYKYPETIGNSLDVFERQYRLLKNVLFYFSRLENTDAIKLRPIILAKWLAFRKALYESFDGQHDFAITVYKNLRVHGPYRSGIDPKHIVEPDIRMDYEERLAKNTQLAYERRVQLTIRQLLEDATKEMEEFICNAYERKPRADDELIQTVEKHELPEDVRIKILSKIGIVYKGFRRWQSTDGLFQTTAKFITLDKGEVTLEKADGKRTTIELSALRQEDQDYVKSQLETEKQTPENKKANDSD